MAQLSLREQARVMRLAAGQARRSGIARVLSSPLLRWRHGAPPAQALVMVPQELRPADPGVADEIGRGQLGLAGATADFGQGSLFAVPPPSPAWEEALHGFEWLRHLRAADTMTATNLARRLVAEWLHRGCAARSAARLPHVRGRRLVSWLANADMLLEGARQAEFDHLLESLGNEMLALADTWASAPPGYDRLLALVGLTYAGLCIAGRERQLAVAETSLCAELARQVLPDGGHASRNPAAILELMLDLLPLRQGYGAAGRAFPGTIETTMTAMMRHLAFMRLGDGALARFNGVGEPALAELSTVLAYDTAHATPSSAACRSRYARLEADCVVLLVDIGTTPPLELAGRAQAGALSFELCAGPYPVLVNAGMPGPAGARHLAAARATASHNALCLGDRSSARLLRTPGLEHPAGTEPIGSLGEVTATVQPTGDAGPALTATFDGWAAEYGLLHTRRLSLATDGSEISGSDVLVGARGPVRLARDIPFAVRFHLHPLVASDGIPDADGALSLVLPDGSHWLFLSKGAAASLEPAVHFASPAGPARTFQIVLRGASWGESTVEWKLVRAAAT
jgi:uncharacterized heparinase superfamily protein